MTAGRLSALSPRERLILALDVPTASDAIHLADQVKDSVGCFKIGLQLFLREGPAVVEAVAALGNPVFLDLKLHDIPVTVAKAVSSLARLPVSMLTLHTGGGRAMLEAAVEAASAFREPPMLLGVTLLTSLSEADFPSIGMTGVASDLVRGRAALAKASGLGGVVASAQEVEMLRQEMGDRFGLVIPGIRPAGAGLDDQKRVETPQRAIVRGATHIVVGRPISASADPCTSARAILAMITEATEADHEPG